MGGWVAVFCVILLATGAFARAAGTTQPMEDSRFAHPFTKDHPAGFTADFADRAAWEKRADFLRHQVLVALGLWPMPDKPPLNPVIHSRIDRGDYTVENVFFASLPGHYVTGNLYRPKTSGKHPAIVSPYGHWPGGRFIWNNDEKIQAELNSGAEVTTEGARTPLQARCAMLARMGCIVFHYDMVGYGDSMKIAHREGFTDADAALRLQSFMGLQTFNGIRAIDFVEALPDVDPARIGVTGASGGGTQTTMLSIIDPRPAVVFPAVMVSMNMQGGCVCENAPLLRIGTNNVELAASFAPKPQGMAAAQDWTHDFETHGLPEMKKIYGFYAAADRVEGKFFPYPHNFNVHSRELMYDMMNRRLDLGQGSPVKEKPFDPIPPEHLSVYDAEHPQPADATDAAGVRRWMQQTSDAQLAALAKDPAQYDQMLRVALESMVADRLPDASDVEIVQQSGPIPLETGGTWNGVISRKGAGERIAAMAIVPERCNGNIIIWSHLLGCRSLLAADGSAAPDVKRLLETGAAVLAIDLFGSGDFHARAAHPSAASGSKEPPYIGLTLGYNRSVIANRVHDLLTVIAMVHGSKGVHSIRLIGFEQAGATPLLARALAGDAVGRAAIDLDRFDFDQVHDVADPMLLPGGLKYGGISSFVRLCPNAPTLVCNVRQGSGPARSAPPAVTLMPGAIAPAAMLEWLTHD